MKKFFLMAAFAVATLGANAQAYIGGGISFSSYTPGKLDESGVADPETQTTIALLPEIGFKLNSSWSFGTQIGYVHYGNYGGVKDKENNTFKIAPYARWTFARIGKVGIFADGQLSYSNSKTSQEDSDGKKYSTKYNTFSLGISPGISIELNKKLSLVTKIGWLGYTSTTTEGYTASSRFQLYANGGDDSLGDLEFALYYSF